ncbi:TonB C-terminal domain-containing protein [Sphingobium nicotianae]|uniref:TonB C-terminal domain-containing protein n=1 Tax=Sphingobium nicotianae TaxID=2782607 RepID=A0A9X1IPQ1_9SPHN|nr:TonB C-terminal domain-containing protein [Sphingobium nicotianae]MBT2186237.1 TonB C-terminal domain-containing protein [Sphingobium nicotianae]
MDRRESLGVGISTVGHVLLFGALSLGLLQTSIKLPPPPATIDVSLADDIALESRTNNPTTTPPEVAQAPEIGQVEPDAAPPVPAPEPEVVEPPPSPKAIEPAKPKPKETPKPQVKAPPKVQPMPRATPRPQRAQRLGNDFLKGLDSDAPTPRNPAPAAAPGSDAPMSAIAARALNAEINRQIKPYWRPPSGADADRLVTLLSVHLDRDGNVVGQVEVVGQQGVTPSNRAQADLHAERAVQAVQRASPFRNLPPEYYDQWKWLKPLRFDARLAQ